MVSLLIYVLLLLLELTFLALFSVYVFSLIYSHFKGSPYVPSKKKEVDHILSLCGLKRGMTFIDLGCGDGRVVMRAVERYGVKGVGIDVNPLLLWNSRIFAWKKRLKHITFRRANILTYDVGKADVIYEFLLPELLTKLVPHLETSMKPGALVVSHGFKIPEWKRFLVKTVKHKPFPTYFYKYSPRKKGRG